MSKRQSIPQETTDELLVESMNRCCLCPQHEEIIDIHHIIQIKDGGGNDKDNLMVICPTCHAKIHRIKRSYTERRLRIYKERWIEICRRPIPIDEKIKEAPSIREEPLIFIPHPYPEAPNFTGRKKEREMLTKWLLEDKEQPLLSMVAIGGMGKSALAWRWLQEEVIEEGLELDGVVWWSFYEREATFGAFVNEAIGYLFPEKGEELIKRSEREKQDLVLNQIFNRRFLLVFDGFERTLRAYSGMSACYIGDEFKREEGEKYRQCVDPNLSWFIRSLGNKGCKTKTLFTTRLHPLDLKGLAGVHEEKLEKMGPEDAVEFFQKQGVKGSAPEIRRACAKYDFLPLCLRLLSGVLITSRKYKRDIKYAREIPDLRLTDVDEYHRDAKKFEHILEFSFDKLKAKNKKLISSIAAFRSPMEFEALRSIFTPKTNEDKFRKRLDCLEKRGMLLYDFEKDHYDLHPVVRRYCYGRLTSPKETHENIRLFFVKVFGTEEEPEVHFDFDNLDFEEEMGFDRLSIEEMEEMPKWQLQDVCEFYQLRKSGTKREIIERLNEFYEDEYFEIYGYDEEYLEKMTVYELKEICEELGLKRTGRRAELIARILDSKEIGEEEPDLDMLSSLLEPEYPKIGSIDDLQMVIELYHHTVGAGRFDEALKLFRERLNRPTYYQFGAYQLRIELMSVLFPDGLSKPPNLSNEVWQAWTLNGLANSYSLSGQPRRAVLLFEIACDIWEKTNDKGSLAIGLNNLANVCQIPIGDLESAESNLRKSYHIGVESGNKFYQGVGAKELGHCLIYCGYFNEAAKYFDIADKLDSARNDYQALGVIWAFRSLRSLLMSDFKEALRHAEESLNIALGGDPNIGGVIVTRDIIRANWLIGASYVAMENIENAEAPLQYAITECRKINLVDTEADILLSIAKLRHLQIRDEESLKLATEALEIANRCGYVLQQADIHLFLAEFYKDKDDIPKAKEHAELAKLRSHQMIDVETGDYISKPEDTEWKYKTCYDKAIAFLSTL